MIEELVTSWEYGNWETFLTDDSYHVLSENQKDSVAAVWKEITYFLISEHDKIKEGLTNEGSYLMQCSIKKSSYLIKISCAKHVGVGSSSRRLINLIDISAKKKEENYREQSGQRYKLLYELSALKGIRAVENLPIVLRAGAELLDLNIGIISKIDSGVYRVLNVYHHEGSIKKGDECPVVNTFCSEVVSNEKLLAIPSVLNTKYQTHPCYKEKKIASYIGTPIFVFGQIFGTLNFSSVDPIEHDFDPVDKDLVRIMANWVGNVLEEEITHAEIVKSDQQMRALYLKAPIGIVISNSDGQLISVNPFACKMWGYTENELKDLTFQSLTYHDDLEESINLLKRLIEGKERYLSMEKRYVTKNGHVIWCKTTLSSIQDEHGDISSIFSLIENITETKTAQIKLEKTNGELEKIAYVATHDIKAPILNIEGHFDFVREEITEGSEDLMESIYWIDQSIKQAKNTIADLVKVIKLRYEEQTKESINVESFVQDILAGMNKTIESKNIQITYDLWVDTIVAGSINLRTILFNLLSNAIKFSDPIKDPVFVILKSGKRGRFFWISITDNGMGMNLQSEKDKIKIFDMFTRLNNYHEGNGIGLYLVRKAVENEGGKIEVESEMGKGTSFTIYLPR